MEPKACGRCGHSMVVSFRSGVVPVWPDQTWVRIVQAHRSLLSSRGDPEQSASRTLWPTPPSSTDAEKTQIHFRRTHTTPSERQSNFSSDSCHFGMDY